MRRVTVAHRLEYAVLRVITFILRAMPLAAASGMMGWLWRKIAPLTKRQKRALDHLRQSFPDKSEEELVQITDGMWENLGRTAAEGLISDKFVKQARALMDVAGNPDEMVAEMHRVGGVIVSLHSGNWELGGVISSEYGYDCSVVIQRLKNPLVHDYMVQQRGSTFRGGIFVKGDRAGQRLMSSIKPSTVAAIMGDLRDKRGVSVPFFDRPAPTNTFPARLARQQQVPLCALRILRTEGIHFRVDWNWVEVPVTDDIEADIVQGTINVQKVFEDWIREVPEQWMWAHKRWG